MKKIFRLMAIAMMGYIPSFAQQISTAEYFYDTDPGVGLGTSVTLTAADSIDITANFLTTGLSAGFHSLFIRVKTDSGTWSLYNGKNFYINAASPAASPEIASAEYFFDTDPGVGNGTAISTGALADTVNILTGIPTTGLPPGFHSLFIRVKNDSGTWSLYNGKNFYINAASLAASPEIASAEYFFDTDPGVGNGTAISTGALADTANILTGIPTTGLPPGFHSLFIRVKNDSGTWSLYNGKNFYINPAPITEIQSKIVKAEYFFDTDPGIGNGITVSPAFSAADSVDTLRNFVTTGLLTSGVHVLTMRVKDSSGVWSLSAGDTFNIISPLTAGAITGTFALCVGANTALTDITSGGTWSSSHTSVATIGSSTGIVTGVSPGTALISFTVSGSRATAVITVKANPGAITGATALCSGLPYAYTDATTGGTWSSSNTSIATISGSDTLTGVAAGTAKITYTIANGCTSSKTFTVYSSPDAITGVTGVCKLASYAFTDDTVGGIWKSSSTMVATVGSTTGIVTGVSTGTTIISYTLPTGCRTTMVVTGLAVPAAITGATTLCSGLPYAYTDATTGGAWSSSDSSIATISSLDTLTGVAAGTARITYTIANGCTSSKTFTVYSSPDAITGVTGVCKLASYTFTDDTVGGIWKSSSTMVATVGSVTGIVTGVSTGTTTISYTLPTGCRTTMVVTGLAVPAAITGATALCSGLPYAYTDATTGGAWSSSDSAIAALSGSDTLTGVAAGTARITYTIANGCTSSKTFTVYSSPDAITGVTGVCKLASYTFTDDTVGGIWKSSSTTVATVGSATGFVTGVSTGTTTISYTLPTGCRSILVVTGLVVPPAITGATALCSGLPYAYTDATAGGAWSSSDPSIAAVSGSDTLTGVAAGTARITYTIANGCTSSKTFTVYSSPDAITGVTGICKLAPYAFADDSTGGLWKSSATTVATVGSVTGIVTGVSTGTTTISYTLPTGCRTTQVITGLALPATITGTTPLCTGLSYAYTDATTGGAWSSSNTSVATIGTAGGAIAVSTGTAMISYISSNGCGVSKTFTVNPSPDAITGAGNICKTVSYIFTDDSTGGVWKSSVTTVATVGSTTGIVTGVSTGSAIISYTLPDGCRTTQVIAGFALPAAISGTGSASAGGSSVTYTDATTGGLWSSSNTSIATVGSTTGVIDGVSPGIVTIAYTTPAGCISIKTCTVTSSGSGGRNSNTNSQTVNINIFPNPNKGAFTISGSLGTNTDETTTLQITDLLGQVVYKNEAEVANGNINEQIQLSNSLANGMYILNIRTEEGNFVFHFVVEQ